MVTPFLRKRVGLRGEVTLLCVYIWLLMAVALLISGGEMGGSVMHRVPEYARAVGWAGTALYSLFVVLTAARWKPTGFHTRTFSEDMFATFVAVTNHKSWSASGVAVLLIMPCARITSHVWDFIMWIIPGGPAGNSMGWYPASIYLALAALVVIAARLEPRSTET